MIAAQKSQVAVVGGLWDPLIGGQSLLAPGSEKGELLFRPGLLLRFAQVPAAGDLAARSRRSCCVEIRGADWVVCVELRSSELVIGWRYVWLAALRLVREVVILLLELRILDPKCFQLAELQALLVRIDRFLVDNARCKLCCGLCRQLLMAGLGGDGHLLSAPRVLETLDV